MPADFFDSMVELITRTSTELPPDVRAAMRTATRAEDPATRAGQALTIISQNIDQASACDGPICQDTGMPTFEVKVPVEANQIALRQQIRDAVAEATRRGKLRPNSVDSITGENSGNNLGPGTPIIHFDQWERADIEVKLILKGGGCENTNAQYALPAELDHLGRADRTLDGVRKCILHAVWKAQGKGCSPGAVGVCVGGDRTSGYLHAKEQLFRTLDDTNPDPRLAAIEASVMDEANRLSVGPMGFSGNTSLIGCKIGALNRLPASFFVSIAYDCWAFRRLGVRVDAGTGAIGEWLYRDSTTPAQPMLSPDRVDDGFPRTGREIPLRAPISEEEIRSLHVGDVVLVSGRIFTGRDAVHAHLMKHDPPVDLRGAVLYHCGPVVVEEGAGPVAPQPHSGAGPAAPQPHSGAGLAAPQPHSGEGLAAPQPHSGEGLAAPKPHSGEGLAAPKPHSGEGLAAPKPQSGEGLAAPKPQSGEGGWRVTAAGPTTSIREEPYQAEILKRYGVRAVIGKGGMGAKTLAGLQESGAVYLNAIGGAAQFYARCIERVVGVSLLEFGTPEAMWHLEVRDFPAIVTMDAHGKSLHREVEEQSGAILETLR